MSAGDPRSLREQALALWHKGYHQHMAGDLPGAIASYTRSIETCPTAEAYTFRGWAYAHQGHVDRAIAECRRAIETDPSFGNPYNDIGSYLVQKGQLDEAVPWLEKAKKAPRYEARHFPFLNLGRIYARKGWLQKAILEFIGALELKPDDVQAREALQRLQTTLH